MLHRVFGDFFFNEVLGAFKFWDASFSTKKKKKKNLWDKTFGAYFATIFFGYYLAIRVF